MTADDAGVPGPPSEATQAGSGRRPPSPLRVGATWLLIGMVAGLGVLAAVRYVSGTGSGRQAAAPAATASLAAGTNPGAPCPTPAIAAGGVAVAPCTVKEAAIGLVTNIDAISVVDVRSFTLRTDAGNTMTFVLVPGVNTGFPPAHLEEHRASGEKVLVTYHVDGGRNLVDHLDDAPASGTTPAPSS